MNDITSDDKLWAALGYPLPIVALIAILMEDKKARPFVKYHAIQSLALNIAIFVVMVILAVTVVGAICAPLLWFVTLWPAFDSYSGKYTELPILSDFIKKQGWV